MNWQYVAAPETLHARDRFNATPIFHSADNGTAKLQKPTHNLKCETNAIPIPHSADNGKRVPCSCPLPFEDVDCRILG